MAMMFAYLDDFGKITLWINRNFYGGRSDAFYLLQPDGKSTALMITGVEDHETQIKYVLTAPADLSFGVDYQVRESHGLIVPLIVRLIVQTQQFNEEFYYDGNDLGAVYHRLHTDFALWAPTAVDVVLRLHQEGREYAYPMERNRKGVWRVRVTGDLSHASYVYLIKRNGVYVESLDPYALSLTGNSRESAVIDLSVLERVPFVQTRGLVSGTDAVIYEASVRDMTSNPITGTLEHATFNALCETGTRFHNVPTGLDYLASLGVSHIQLMPVLDFRTVDEFNPSLNYNWGYDPVHYLALDGSFSSNPNDPYSRMVEFRKLVAAMHKQGLRVNMDVVFNHLYDVDSSCYNCTVPYYYFRYNESGFLSNGSYCGNDFASNQPMGRKYLDHVIATLMKIYDVDGFRFDLMGVLDVTTMNCLHETALSIKKDAMIYGEGWDMPTQLEWSKKACIVNQNKMPDIGHFNDYFRDEIKGRTSDDQKYEKGYATGDLNKAFAVLSALSANVLNDPYFMRFTTPNQSINGIETHDNATLWDKMHFCCGNEDRNTRRKRQKLMIGMTLVSQGIPFLHAGIEFCGTKNDNGNSYNAPDSINQMNWERAEYNADVIDYTKRAIALRKKYQAFRLKDTQVIAQCVRLSVAEGGVIFYDIDYTDPVTSTSIVRVIINPSFDDKYYQFEPGWKIVFDENGNESSADGEHVTVPGLTMFVLTREQS